jgi:hypothetical protein
VGEKLRKNHGRFGFGGVVGGKNCAEPFGEDVQWRALPDARARLSSGGGGRWASTRGRMGWRGAKARRARWRGAGPSGGRALGRLAQAQEGRRWRWAERGGGKRGEKGAGWAGRMGQGRGGPDFLLFFFHFFFLFFLLFQFDIM